jgi:TetR/AcrR family transcriptional repressor of bet genes
MNFHFKSMELLLAAAFDHLAEEFDRIWRARVAKASDAPWERLGAMIEAYFAPEVFSSEKLAVWFSFWVDADLRDEFRTASVKIERRYHREIEPEVTRLLVAASVPEADKEAARITGMLTAMVDGYWLQALLYPRAFRAKAAVAACLDFLRIAISIDASAAEAE